MEIRMLNYDITQPLPGWIRFQNADTGKIIDINPQHYAHRLLLERYSKNPKWEIISKTDAL
jgi:hypothetical protein